MRLPRVERKKEILDAARELFLEKGFSKVTMEDVVSRTSLSKGGLYHYYKSTHEMIFDIFMEANDYRISKIKENIDKNKKVCPLDFESERDLELVAQMITDKVLDINSYMELYTIFLTNAKYDDKLRKTFEHLMSESILTILYVFKGVKTLEELDKKDSETMLFITHTINTMILGMNLLVTSGIYRKNSSVVKEMIKIGIRTFRQTVE